MRNSDSEPRKNSESTAGNSAASDNAAGDNPAISNTASDNVAADNAAGDTTASDNVVTDNVAGYNAAGYNAVSDDAAANNNAGSYNVTQAPEEHAPIIETTTRLHVIEPQPSEELSNSERHLSSATHSEHWSADSLSAVSQAGQLQQNSQELAGSVQVNLWSALKHCPSDATPHLLDADEDADEDEDSSDDNTIVER